jgi:hypothetical protein
MDDDWARFRKRVQALPIERLADRLGDGAWTRKQMLGHISTWHELTFEPLRRFVASGEPSELDEDEDTINARAARAAEGRTSGEVLQTMDDTFRRLRREVSLLSDAQLAANDSWAAAVIAGNTYGHYAEHLPDLG